jgi:hypothetical protein
MTDKNIVAIAIGITIVLYPFYFAFIKRYRKSANSVDMAVVAKRDGNSVMAISRKLRWHQGDSNASTLRRKTGFWTVTYEYVVEGKAYRKKFIVDRAFEDSPPSETMFYYLPNNPRKAFTDDQAKYSSERQIGCLSVIAIPIAFMALLFYIMRIFIL